MAEFPKLKVEKRTLVGRKVKKLRRDGLIPANIFGKKISSVAVQVDHKSFTKIFETVGETGIVDVSVGEDKYPCLISGHAVDSVTGDILHVDFHHVSLKEKVTATIPVHVIGESPAVKDQGGVLNQSLHEIEVEALPTDLPEAIEVDITGLVNIGDSITVKDLKVSDKLEIKIDLETAVLVVNEPAKEEVVETPPETEIIGEEGEAPAADGEAAPTTKDSEAPETAPKE